MSAAVHVAFVCPEMHGHLNPMSTLASEFARRGHRISFIGTPRAQPKIDACGFSLIPVGVPEHDSGQAEAELERLARMKGLGALRLTGRLLRDIAALTLRDAPDQLRQAGVDALVVDQVSPAGAAIADVLGIPFVVVCNAMAMHQEPGLPPGVMTWRYRTGLLSRLRNRFGNMVLGIATGPINRTLSEYRLKHGLAPYRFGEYRDSGLAQIAQQPAFFDFPRKGLPPHFHYTGPWHAAGRDTETAPFPWDKLDGRPIIYASLGTVQNRLSHVFCAILEGCSRLPVQLVLALGRRDAIWDGPVPANALVVPFAPQLRLLDRASLLITHAGLNTALEGLARGLPMLCIPVTNDQPGVARRVEWIGAGEVLLPARASAARVKSLVEKLLAGARYRDIAGNCRKQIEENPGAARAADIIEEAFRTRKRVDRKREPAAGFAPA